jgi:hypothetical protein
MAKLITAVLIITFGAIPSAAAAEPPAGRAPTWRIYEDGSGVLPDGTAFCLADKACDGPEEDNAKWVWDGEQWGAR